MKMKLLLITETVIKIYNFYSLCSFCTHLQMNLPGGGPLK